MKRRLRKLGKILLLIPVVVIAFIVALAGYDAYLMNADARYHQTLIKSLQVASNDFQQEKEMPVQFSCRGPGISPQIAWSGAPPSIKSYALVVTDVDAPAPYLRLFPVVHWVVYNIPRDVQEIRQNASSAELQQEHVMMGNNIAGNPGYAPPCPPLGQHRYIFRIYALDVDSIAPVTKDKAGVMKAVDGHVLAYGELIGLRSPGNE